jgi:general secretion pathway protein D
MQYRVRQCAMTSILLIAVIAFGATQAYADSPETQPASQPAAGQRAPRPATSQRTSQPAAGGSASAPASQVAKPMPIAFNKAPINQVAEFLTKQLGKPVLISSEIEKVQVTLVNPKPLPLEEAMYVLRTALLEQGVAIEERNQTIHLVPVAQINSRQIPTLGPDGDMAAIKPANQIVRKIFEIKHYNVSRLVEMLKPLLPPAYGDLRADPANGTLIIVATAEDLTRMAEIIRQLDKPEQGGRQLRIFDVKNVDVYEIMPTLEKLIAMQLGGDIKVLSASASPAGPGGGGRGGPGGPGGGSAEGAGGGRPGGPGDSKASKAGAAIIVVQSDQQKSAVFLSADPRRSAIIVEAPPNVLTQVEHWIKDLDQPRPPSTDLETIDIHFGDPEDLCAKLTTMINGMPDESLRNAVRLFPFPASRKLMIRGTEQNRKIVKGLLAEIDVDTGEAATKTVTIKYGDAQEIAENIKELFSDKKKTSFWDDYYGGYGGSSRNKESDYGKVTVTANVRRNSITIVAAPEKLKRIEEQIKEWDKPLTGEEASPRIYTIKYADPDKIRELLENLFTKKEKSATPWWWSSNSEPEGAASPVGRLFGQFRFEAYPDLGKLVVVSKNEENYAVIDDLLKQIDTPQTAGLPRVIQLKYAFAEPLAEQLNALLNAPGTPTSVVRRDQTPTFTAASNNTQGSPYANGNGNSNNNSQQSPQQQQQGQMEQGIMRFWWQYIRQDIKEKQPSNLIGKMRIVPNIEQNLLLVIAPEGNAEAIEQMVRDLDKPGHQVFIKAVIAEITHQDATSLGYRFSSDPTIFQTGDPAVWDNALKGLLTYQFKDNDSHNTLTFNMDVHNLISALRRVTDIKIKSEPSLMVYDNIEGQFFDGQDIPFLTNSNAPALGGLTQSFDYKPVGITLRVRPHITMEGRVAMTVNISASSIVPGQMLFGSYIIDRRETNQHVVLENGRTFMISGMLRSEDHTIIRRIPGLGDIPGLGEIFKHREMAKVNTELLIFLTPFVITQEASREMLGNKPLERLRKHNMLPEGVQEPPPPPAGDAGNG